MKRKSILGEILKDLKKERANFWYRCVVTLRFLRLSLFGRIPGAVPKPVQEAWSQMNSSQEYNPDAETDALANPVVNPVIAFHEALKEGKAKVTEAFVFEAHFDERGKMVRDKRTLEALPDHKAWPAHYRIRNVKGTEAYRELLTKCEATHKKQPDRSKKARESNANRFRMAKKMREDGFFGWDFFSGTLGQGYDPNQYTEFAPTMGGPFFKQQYMTDRLKSLAYAFEAWNHNPIAKRIIQLLTQYGLGRRFEFQIKDERQEKAWDEFNDKHKITEKVCNFWSKEGDLYGDTMIDIEKWDVIDPSTVWDIITDPDNVNDEYYYYQSYPTAYQMFTGYKVPDEPGSEKQAATEYIVRQIPAHKIIHRKYNCVSNEKFGRTLLFPILGWLKRVKDLYNAQVVRQWLLSCMVWDITIKGNQSDVSSYASQYNTMPNPGSTEVHNESVTRKPMPAIDGAGGKGGGGTEIAESLLAFIATAVGIPKEFFNLIATGGGNRAQALTSAEPFTKVIEDKQAHWEEILTVIFTLAMAEAGLPYKKGDVEITFPSVSKDTTTETLKNLGTAEEMQWISKRTAATIAAKEIGITQYDFDDEQKAIKEEIAKGISTPAGFGIGTTMPPDGRFGGGGEDPNLGKSEIHGQGKVDLASNLKSL